MRFATMVLGLVIAASYALPAQAVIEFEDTFNGSGSLDGRTPNTGGAWGGSGSGHATVSGGRAIFDAASAGTTISANVDQTFTLPTLSSNNKMVMTVEVSGLGGSESVEASDFVWLSMGNIGGTGAHNEFHLVDMGKAVQGTEGNYNVGTWTDTPSHNLGMPRHWEDTGVAVVSGADSHVITSEIINTGSGISRQAYISINGGAKALLGPAIEYAYEAHNGTGAENPGILGSHLKVTARGGDSKYSNAAFSVDYLRIETIPVPEPASIAMLGLGGLLLARRKRS